ncbi:MAG: hypothetical protein KBS91_03085 [Firmicutes bacterium]|nr:hypothetical protein [Candidatus Caballimonas caccae]
MNIYFAKTILYAYPVIDEVISQLDELVLKKAYSSMYDFSPAITQCEKIVDYSNQKGILLILKKAVNEVLSTFSEEDILHLDYKFFKKKEPKEFVHFDYLSRNYFRRQIKIFDRFNEKIEKKGIDDCWFKQNCLSVDFFRSLLKNVIEREEYSYKNKKAVDKKIKKEVSIKVNEIYKSIVA